MSTKNAKSLTLKRRKAMKGVLLKVKEGGKDSTSEKIWDQSWDFKDSSRDPLLKDYYAKGTT